MIATVIATGVMTACGSPAPTGEPATVEERGPQAIVEWSDADDHLIVYVGTCRGEPVAQVVEDAPTVSVTITSTNRSPFDSCLDSLEVPLSSPLGNRAVIDGVTGEEPPRLDA